MGRLSLAISDHSLWGIRPRLSKELQLLPDQAIAIHPWMPGNKPASGANRMEASLVG
jgi:hypothetical protein